MINYVSTRGMEGSFSAAEAIVKGIADDKGLFVPTEIPSLTVNFDDLAKMTYQQIAKKMKKVYKRCCQVVYIFITSDGKVAHQMAHLY